MSSGDFARIARDLCVSPAGLDAVVRQGPHASDELPRLLKALGIDEATLSRTQPSCSATWCASVPRASKRHCATIISMPASSLNAMRNTALMRRRSTNWTDGHNVRIDFRWAAGNAENYRKYAAELIALARDVILTPGGSFAPMFQATRTVPVAFAIDPVGSGFFSIATGRPRNWVLTVRIQFEREMDGAAQ